MLFALLTACLPKYPGPDAPVELAHWTASVEAMPEEHLRAPVTNSRLFRYQSATPSSAGELYGTTSGDGRSLYAMERALWVCRVSQIHSGTSNGLPPDLRVELSIGDRLSTFAYENETDWPFTLGLVDLIQGEPISLEVTADQLGSDVVLLAYDDRFDGRVPLRWTHRDTGTRTSLLCKVLSNEDRDALAERRLDAAWKMLNRNKRRKASQQDAEDAVRALAAVVGWSDPRVRFLLREVGQPDDSGESDSADVSSDP